MKFVELTMVKFVPKLVGGVWEKEHEVYEEKRKVLINVEDISIVCPIADNRTKILLSSNIDINVVESFDNVREMLKGGHNDKAGS